MKIIKNLEALYEVDFSALKEGDEFLYGECVYIKCKGTLPYRDLSLIANAYLFDKNLICSFSDDKKVTPLPKDSIVVTISDKLPRTS